MEHPQDRALPDPGDRKADRRSTGGGTEGAGQRGIFRREGAGVREHFTGIADHGRRPDRQPAEAVGHGAAAAGADHSAVPQAENAADHHRGQRGTAGRG